MLRARSGYCHRVGPTGGAQQIAIGMHGILQILAAAGLGAACGIAGGLFGVGGGVIAIPMLGMLYGLEQQTAQGTVLIMVAPNVLLGFWHYRRRVGIDLRIAA